MEAAHMTYKEEVLRLRAENKHLRQENSRLKRHYELAKQRIVSLERENKEHKQEIKDLKKENAQLRSGQEKLQKQVESCLLLIEELRGMVFGKRTKKNSKDTATQDEETTPEGKTGRGQRKPAERDNASYRRSAPADEEVTDLVTHHLTHCPDCGTLLIALKTVIQYLEDIQDVTTLAKLLKQVEKHVITTGYCPNCKKRKTAIDIAPQVSILGENVRKFIAYLIVVMGQSFFQVRCFLQDTANLHISDGEIVESLDQYAQKLVSEQDRIRVRIRGAPGRHYDETGWPVQQGGDLSGNYCWITTPTEGEDAFFLMGKSRGKAVAEEIRGEKDDQIGISDDYAGYDTIFKKHQLCMSHPKRKLRDLVESKTLTGEKKKACIQTYTAFSLLYIDLEKTLKTSYQKEAWLKKREEYIERMRELAVVEKDDPEKLKTLKQTLTEKAELYLTCLLKPGIPADNNKAERKLRHVVLKRRRSQGSKSDKGARTMGILCTTLLSCWWKKPKNFFVAFNEMLAI